MEQDIAGLRREYADGGLSESELEDDPMAMFRRWFDEATEAGLYEPNALVLATATADGVPSSRMVLLKELRDDAGFVFFTNLGSRTGVELGVNAACALLFPWHPLERQVRVDGAASLLPRADVAAYFSTRPRGSQVGAHASHQSRPVNGREELAGAYADATARFEGSEVPVPDEWGGFLVRAESVEFWQGRPGRMHDRLVYRRDGSGGWATVRLAP